MFPPSLHTEKIGVETDIEYLYKARRTRMGTPRTFDQMFFRKARKLKEERELNCTIWRWASYFLFALGWGLTFYGQLSGLS
jgi:hypothetical protein